MIGVYEQPGLAEAESKLSPIPEHLQAVTPRLAVPEAMSALDFYTRAFGAELLGEPFAIPPASSSTLSCRSAIRWCCSPTMMATGRC